MSDLIISIEKLSGNYYDQYTIKTTNQTVEVGIENHNLCYEEWGIGLIFPDENKQHDGSDTCSYLKDTGEVCAKSVRYKPSCVIGHDLCEEHDLEMEKKQIDSFIGASVSRVKWDTDEILETGTGNWNLASVIIITDRGNLSIRLWNYHNGYYPHTIFARWNGYEDMQEL
jgi:hypothetical protein